MEEKGIKISNEAIRRYLVLIITELKKYQSLNNFSSDGIKRSVLNYRKAWIDNQLIFFYSRSNFQWRSD